MIKPENKPFDPFNQVDKQRFDEEEFWIWVDFFCERYGWSIEQVFKMRVRTFYKLQEAIVERNKRESKAVKMKK